jgi:zinc/manganese transport system substrate-binding protein
MRAIRSVPALTAVALAFAVTGCGASADDAADDGRISVVTSTNVWGSVAKAVGGDRVKVESLINDAAADPHGYVDKPEDATKLSGAALAIYNGGGYDDFFAKLTDAAGQGAKRIEAFEIAGQDRKSVV